MKTKGSGALSFKMSSKKIALRLLLGLTVCCCAYMDFNNNSMLGVKSMGIYEDDERDVDVKYVFVLYAGQTEADQNDHVSVFRSIATDIKSKYNSSLTFLVRHFSQAFEEKHHPTCECTNADDDDNDCLVCYEKPPSDRTCLMLPPNSPERIRTSFSGNLSNRREVERFIKAEAELLIEDLLMPLHHDLYALPKLPSCEDIDASKINFKTFLRKYWLPQKPVVIRNVRNVRNLSLLRILSTFKNVIVGA